MKEIGAQESPSAFRRKDITISKLYPWKASCPKKREKDKVTQNEETWKAPKFVSRDFTTINLPKLDSQFAIENRRQRSNDQTDKMILRQIFIPFLVATILEQVQCQMDPNSTAVGNADEEPTEVFWPKNQDDCSNKTLLELMDFSTWRKGP